MGGENCLGGTKEGDGTARVSGGNCGSSPEIEETGSEELCGARCHPHGRGSGGGGGGAVKTLSARWLCVSAAVGPGEEGAGMREYVSTQPPPLSQISTGTLDANVDTGAHVGANEATLVVEAVVDSTGVHSAGAVDVPDVDDVAATAVTASLYKARSLLYFL